MEEKGQKNKKGKEGTGDKGKGAGTGTGTKGNQLQFWEKYLHTQQLSESQPCSREKYAKGKGNWTPTHGWAPNCLPKIASYRQKHTIKPTGLGVREEGQKQKEQEQKEQKQAQQRREIKPKTSRSLGLKTP